MRRKVLIVLFVFVSAFWSAILFVSLICGAPSDKGEMARYLFGAAGMSLILPGGFIFFLIRTLDLTRELEKYEQMQNGKEETKGQRVTAYLQQDEEEEDFRLPVLMSALDEKRNLSREESDELISYLEDL